MPFLTVGFVHESALLCRNRYIVLIEFREASVAETRDLDENTILDVDAQGNICSITVEHASKRAGAPHFSFEEIAA
jgi:uncharacterized protein YuzE